MSALQIRTRSAEPIWTSGQTHLANRPDTRPLLTRHRSQKTSYFAGATHTIELSCAVPAKFFFLLPSYSARSHVTALFARGGGSALHRPRSARAPVGGMRGDGAADRTGTTGYTLLNHAQIRPCCAATNRTKGPIVLKKAVLGESQWKSRPWNDVTRFRSGGRPNNQCGAVCGAHDLLSANRHDFSHVLNFCGKLRARKF